MREGRGGELDRGSLQEAAAAPASSSVPGLAMTDPAVITFSNSDDEASASRLCSPTSVFRRECIVRRTAVIVMIQHMSDR